MKFPKNYQELKSFFLENQTVKQIIFKNLTWVTFSSALTKVLTLFLTIFMARILGAEGYGSIAFALAFTGFFGLFADLGITTIMIREFSKKEDIKEEFRALFWLRTFLGILSIFLIVIASLFVKEEALRLILIIFAFVFFFKSMLSFFVCFFQSLQRMEFVALVDIGDALFLFSGIALILFFSPQVILISYAYLFSSILILGVALLITRKLSFSILPKLDIAIIKKYFSMSWPLALSSVFAAVYLQFGSVVMGFWDMLEELGLYQASYRIANFVVFPATIIAAVFYPAISKSFKEDRSQFKKINNAFFEVITFFVFPITVGGYFLADEIILFIYGESFLASVAVFKILIFASGFLLLIVFLEYVLNAIGHQKVIFYTAIFATLLNLILSIILIPRYSFNGAGMAIFFTYLLIFVSRFLFLKKISLLPSLRVIITPFLAVLAMSFFLYFTAQISLHLITKIILAGIVYLILFLLLRLIFKKHESVPNLH